MRLRAQLLVFLLLFGLAPLSAVYLIVMPLVLEQLELFYHKAHLQNLRADFGDLDQHLASRNEVARLLAKMPEPGMVLGNTATRAGLDLDAARSGYIGWISQILDDQQDINEIAYYDRNGVALFWLSRSQDTGEWQPTIEQQRPLDPALFEAVMKLQPGGVLTSRINIDPERGAKDRTRFMNLRFVSPVYSPDAQQRYFETGIADPDGVVVINVDVGGMARVYRNAYWVYDDGYYMNPESPNVKDRSAFDDYPGLQTLFERNNLALWEGSVPVLWVPIFHTKNGGPLWVGRDVDPSPIANFKYELQIRVAIIVSVLVILVLFVARLISIRAERFGNRLKSGIGEVLQQSKPVKFSWRGPQEIQALANDLTELSQKHADNMRSLRAHAAELERSNRYKSEFLANVSHELKTPLNSILVLSKMLTENREEALPDWAVEQARVIYAAGDDLLGLINNILDLSRIEAGHAQFKPAEIDLELLVQELIDLLRPQFENKKLYLQTAIEKDVPTHLVNDRDKLRQVVKNFLSNAVKFTRKGGVTIRIGWNTDYDVSERPVCVSVSDTGIGIAWDKQKVIFQAFQQADGSINRNYGGTGLGLAISNELAHLMGGRITLESESGKGARFCILLPLEKTAGSVTRDIGRTDAADDVDVPVDQPLPEISFEGGRVMVIDDDLRTLLSMTPLLELLGMEVMAAGDPEEAFESLKPDQDYSAIFVSTSMSGVDGYDTIRQIREIPGFAGTPIIVLTGGLSDELRQKLNAAGVNGFLLKPVDSLALREVLESTLSTEMTTEA